MRYELLHSCFTLFHPGTCYTQQLVYRSTHLVFYTACCFFAYSLSFFVVCWVIDPCFKYVSLATFLLPQVLTVNCTFHLLNPCRKLIFYRLQETRPPPPVPRPEPAGQEAPGSKSIDKHQYTLPNSPSLAEAFGGSGYLRPQGPVKIRPLSDGYVEPYEFPPQKSAKHDYLQLEN